MPFVPGRLEPSQHIGLLRLGGMDFEAVASKPDLLEATLQDLKRRGLLRDEEDAASDGQALGDHIADRLA